MIDLSFLTEEEQEAIMKVLQRDAELKRAEEERVRHLPEKIKDDVQLKNMSGQWFYEAKSKRHRDKIHGADIIRASMRRKPTTIAEVSQNKSNKAKNSWVSNVNKEVFVQPKLYDVVEHQEEEMKSSSSSKTTASVLDKPQRQSGKATVSPVKQRRNPFNSTSSGENPNSGESENEPVSLPQLSKKEMLSPSKENQPKANLLNNEMEKPKKSCVEPTNQSQRSPVKPPVPKARKLIQKATDPMSQREHVVPEPAKRTGRVNGAPARGILKRSSSSSSTDSEVLRVNQMFDAQTKSGLPTSTIFEGEAEKSSPLEVEDSSQISLERLKQVRFSSSIGEGESPQSPQLHHGREIGEFDLLETDEVKGSENDVISSDSLVKKQISAVKPLGIYSSTLQVNEINALQEDTSASSPPDSNRSVFLASETLQTKIVPSKKPETPEKPSSTVPANNNKELIVDEMRENKSEQFLSNEPKSLKSFPDRHLLSAETEAREVSNSDSAGLQQGKPELVEEQDAENTCKPDKPAAELVEASDEPMSKILDWFKRSSGSGDRKPKLASLQGRKPKEDMDFSSRKAVLATDHSGPYMDGKTQVTEESLFGKTEKMKSVSPPWRRDAALLQREDTQLIREKKKPKQGERNDKESEESLTGFVCRKGEEKESDKEIMQESKKSSLLEHQEYKQPPQTCESEKAIREKRRIKEIREFWEKTIPGPKQKEADVSINASDSSMLKGFKESDKIKPTAGYLSNGLHNQSSDMLQRTELSDK
ncbi:PREDICTED: synaptotagmin-like protein 2, partial [Tinamus guttatus]|uniref:synaptotagmin-like protein 2 n=1 Tax=Tinamus guttatus TaxID=94827 RepID=UPI00052EF043